MVDMFGYQASEIIGMGAMDFVSPEYREKVKDNILAGYEKSYESIGLKKMVLHSPSKYMPECFHIRGSRHG